jgi:hypothetical protein
MTDDLQTARKAAEATISSGRGRIRQIRPDWRFARSLGELQILTRVSYVILGLVPVLAGVWSSLPFEKSSHLPRSWAYAFLAALGVTVAQVIYQLRAPEVVRRSTLDAYVRNARQEYADQPTPERLEQARDRLDRRYPRRRRDYHYYPEGRDIEVALAVLLLYPVELRLIEKTFGTYVSYETLLVQRNLRPSSNQNHKLFDQYEERMSPEQLEKARFLHNLTTVGHGARYEYLMAADQRPFSMSTASLLYIAAIFLIAIITIEQTLSVLHAAGWLR